MKPSRFEYHAPASLAETLALLAEHGEEAKLLAGGQSLVPAMNFRLATPAVLVDLNRIEGHDRVWVDGDELVIETLVRHRALESVLPDDSLGRLLGGLSHYVGHLPIRVRGTFVGSLAHADPAAEWCMLAVALDAVIVLAGPDGTRRVAAGDFFEGLFTTATRPDEVITEVRLPLLRNAGVGFREKSQTAGDFATIATVAVLHVEEEVVRRAQLGIAGAEGVPLRATAAEEVLVGSRPTPETLAAAARAAAASVDPVSDSTCSADYRRHLVEVLLERSLTDAQNGAVA